VIELGLERGLAGVSRKGPAHQCLTPNRR
jgi:hypothetical protein